MSKKLRDIVASFKNAAAENPSQAPQIYRKAASTFLGYAKDPKNAKTAAQLNELAARFSADAELAANRPATVSDFEDLLREYAESYEQVDDNDDMGIIARRNEIHEERTPGLPRVSITPKSVNRSTRLGDVVTLKWQPTAAERNLGLKESETLLLWQGEKEESQTVTIDTILLNAPLQNNPDGGPRPYATVSYGSDGAVANVNLDIGQRCTVVGSYVSVSVALNPPRTDYPQGQATIGASMGFFAAPSVAPVIYTYYIDDLGEGITSALIPRPPKAIYLQPIQSLVIGGSAEIYFYALDGTVVQYAVPYINGSQNVPIPITGDIAFLKVKNTGAGPRFRLPFELSL